MRFSRCEHYRSQGARRRNRARHQTGERKNAMYCKFASLQVLPQAEEAPAAIEETMEKMKTSPSETAEKAVETMSTKVEEMKVTPTEVTEVIENLEAAPVEATQAAEALKEAVEPSQSE